MFLISLPASFVESADKSCKQLPWPLNWTCTKDQIQPRHLTSKQEEEKEKKVQELLLLDEDGHATWRTQQLS